MNASSALDAGRGFIRRGWSPIPVPFREKEPRLLKWQTLRLDERALAEHFNGQPSNISVLLGEPSSNLVDIDLDVPEALQLADVFLPATRAVFGRASKARSHREYVSVIDTEKFLDVAKHGDDTSMLVEIRSTGCQTVFPGSTHPTGEPIEWAEDGEPARVDATELRPAVVRLALAVLLARHWPPDGSRHEGALAAAGFLARAGVDDEHVVTIVMQAARAGHDGEWRDRKRAALDTVAAIRSGEAATGGPRLAELLTGDGAKAVERMRRWLGANAAERFNLTDSGNAQRFARDHGRDVRYCYAWSTWLEWDGRRWTRDAGDGVMVRAKDTARRIFSEAAAAATEDERKRLASWAVKSESEPALRRMLILAQSEPGIPVTPAELDRDPYALNTPSGTLELRTLHLRPHRREDLITKLTAAPYSADARHPVLEAFLTRVLPDEDVRAFVQRVAGYACTGSIEEEKLFFVHGPTAGGKSTLLRALRAALGDYATVADFATFCERDQGGPREDIARLAGVRLVVSVEVKDGTRLAEGLVKWLSGGDVIAARRLYESTFEFLPTFKLVLAANHRPRARDDDDALWRRILEVPFGESIPESERDPGIKRALCDPAVGGAAVLAWATEGAARWCEAGCLSIPGAVRAATGEYRQAMDPLRDFLGERCVFEPFATVAARELRGEYEAWARENGNRYPLNGHAFAERLKARRCEQGRRRGGERIWRGVRLRTADDAEPGDTGDAGDVNSDNFPIRARAGEELGKTTSPTSPTSPRHSPGLRL